MTPDEMKEQLLTMPLSERVAMLICSVAGTHPKPQAWAAGIIGVLTTLTQDCSAEDRASVAARMRTAADGLEGATRPLWEDRFLPVVH